MKRLDNITVRQEKETTMNKVALAISYLVALVCLAGDPTATAADRPPSKMEDQTRDELPVAVSPNQSALAALKIGAYDTAITELTIALKANESDAPILNYRAIAYAGKREFQKAIRDLTLAVSTARICTEYLINRGVMYSAAGDQKKALQDFDEAIILDPKSARGLFNRAVIYFYLGIYDKAVSDLTNLLLSRRDSVSALVLRGCCYSKMGEYPEAVTLHSELGLSYLGSERDKECLSKAEEDLRHAIRLAPRTSQPYAYMGMHYLARRQTSEAQASLTTAIRLDPQDSVAYYYLGMLCKEHNRDSKKAVEYFSRAIELDALYCDAYLQRGLAYKSMGKDANGREDYREYKKLRARGIGLNSTPTITYVFANDLSSGFVRLVPFEDLPLLF